MGCFVAHFVWAVVVHFIYGLLQCTICLWAVVMHMLYGLMWNVCMGICSVNFYGLF